MNKEIEAINEYIKIMRQKNKILETSSNKISNLINSYIPREDKYEQIFKDFVASKFTNRKILYTGLQLKTDDYYGDLDVVLWRKGFGLIRKGCWKSPDYEKGFEELLEIYKTYGEALIIAVPENARETFRKFIEHYKNMPILVKPKDNTFKIELTDELNTILKEREHYGTFGNVSNVRLMYEYGDISLYYNQKVKGYKDEIDEREFSIKLRNFDDELLKVWCILKDRVKEFCNLLEKQAEEYKNKSIENYAKIREAFREDFILQELKKSNEELK